MNCLVTGGAGFIGSHIIDGLLEYGASIRVLDNLSTGSIDNISHILNDIEFIEGDIRDVVLLTKAMQNIDYVFHQAALPSISRSIKAPVETHNVNATGSLQVLIAARDANVKRVIYAGSSSVYGNTEILPKVESMYCQPISPYALTKYIGEQYCKIFSNLYGLETVVLRYFNIFGPRQNPFSTYAGVIPTFIRCLMEGKSPKIYGDGLQSRDFTYVANAVHANLLAMKAQILTCETFNIACGERITIKELFDKLNAIFGVNVKPDYYDSRPGEVRHSFADISKARELLGYEPKVALFKGLEQTVKYFQDLYSLSRHWAQ